jgi:LemA protein
MVSRTQSVTPRRDRVRVFRRAIIRPLLFALLCAVMAEGKAWATVPAYLSDMPTVAQVLAKIRGSDDVDTAARQAAAFTQLDWTIRALTAGGEFGNTKFTPDEQALFNSYSNASNEATTRGHAALVASGAPATGPDSPTAKWAHAFLRYNSDSFRKDVLDACAPRARSLYDARKGGGLPTLPSVQLPPSLAPALPQAFGGSDSSSSLGRNATMLIVIVLVVVLGWYLIRTRNGLYTRLQNIKQHKANITHIVEMKSTLVNELYQVVQSQVQAEQLVHLTVSKDTAGGGITGAYQQAGAMLSAVQNFAQRFPQLQQSGAFHTVMQNIQGCEQELKKARQYVNGVIGDYNKYRGDFPRNVFASILQFKEEEFVNFDVTNARGPAQAIRLGSDDGRRLDHLLGTAPAAPALGQPIAPAQLGPMTMVQPARGSLPPGGPTYAPAPSANGARGGGTQALQAIPMMAPSASIRFLAGPLGGRSVPVGPGAVVGREPAAAQIVVPDPQVSSAHAWIGMRGASLTFVDQGSTNGSIVNGAPVRAGDEIPLKHGDVVSLGRTNSVQFVVEQS